MSTAAQRVVSGGQARPAGEGTLIRLQRAEPVAGPSWELSGLLALVVTDLEGFTPLVEQLGDERARALMQQHNALVRAVIAEHDGREVAHTGDGIMCAFRSVTAALNAAARIQITLARYTERHPRMPLRARIGVHAGEPLPSDQRLIGTCVNAAVRVCAVARAEHVLVSDLARNLAAGSDLGFGPARSVALKGLSQRMRVHELQWRALGGRERAHGCCEA